MKKLLILFTFALMSMGVSVSLSAYNDDNYIDYPDGDGTSETETTEEESDNDDFEDDSGGNRTLETPDGANDYRDGWPSGTEYDSPYGGGAANPTYYDYPLQ